MKGKKVHLGRRPKEREEGPDLNLEELKKELSCQPHQEGSSW